MQLTVAAIAIFMTATARIAVAPPMVVPEGIAKVEIAGIGGGADHGARAGADCGAKARIAGCRANDGTAGRADQCAAGGTIARIGSAACQHHCGKAQGNEFDMHVGAPFSVRAVTCGTEPRSHAIRPGNLKRGLNDQVRGL
jgi:hypothetical protein